MSYRAYPLFDNQRDAVLLVARILMMVLFVWGGVGKLTDFSGAIGEMVGANLPLPTVAAAIAVIFEFFVGIAIVLGFQVRVLAFLLALYTLATAFLGHHYWTMTGTPRLFNMINFYKNISIVAGLLVLSITGGGRYSIDRR